MKKIIAKEITAKKGRCVVGACPTVFKTNRKDTSCIGLGCSSVFKTNHKTLIIIGKVPAGKDLPKNILRKLGEGEVAVEVPSSIFP